MPLVITAEDLAHNLERMEKLLERKGNISPDVLAVFRTYNENVRAGRCLAKGTFLPPSTLKGDKAVFDHILWKLRKNEFKGAAHRM